MLKKLLIGDMTGIALFLELWHAEAVISSITEQKEVTVNTASCGTQGTYLYEIVWPMWI